MAHTAITIKDLKELCELHILLGNGDKKIMISADDEGNGYHELFYGFTSVNEVFAGKFSPSAPYGVDETNIDQYIILG